MKILLIPFIPFTLFFVVAALILTSCGEKEHPETIRFSRNRIERGEQLVSEGRCNYCHTPTKGTAEGTVPDEDRLLSGHPSDEKIPDIPKVPVGSQQWMEFQSNLSNTVWAGPWGVSFSTNLTPDKETGIGTCTVKDFANAMRTGKHAGFGRKILPPMPWSDYSHLSDEDLISIFAYLKSIKPVKNRVPDPIKFDERP